jgi:hypothetical protein
MLVSKLLDQAATQGVSYQDRRHIASLDAIEISRNALIIMRVMHRPELHGHTWPLESL